MQHYVRLNQLKMQKGSTDTEGADRTLNQLEALRPWMGFGDGALAGVQDQAVFIDLDVRFRIGRQGELQGVFEALLENPLGRTAGTKLMIQASPGYRRRAFQHMQTVAEEDIEIERRGAP